MWSPCDNRLSRDWLDWRNHRTYTNCALCQRCSQSQSFSREICTNLTQKVNPTDIAGEHRRRSFYGKPVMTKELKDNKQYRNDRRKDPQQNQNPHRDERERENLRNLPCLYKRKWSASIGSTTLERYYLIIRYSSLAKMYTMPVSAPPLVGKKIKISKSQTVVQSDMEGDDCGKA